MFLIQTTPIRRGKEILSLRPRFNQYFFFKKYSRALNAIHVIIYIRNMMRAGDYECRHCSYCSPTSSEASLSLTQRSAGSDVVTLRDTDKWTLKIRGGLVSYLSGQVSQLTIGVPLLGPLEWEKKTNSQGLSSNVLKCAMACIPSQYTDTPIKT